MEKGALAGYPLQDVHFTVLDGSYGDCHLQVEPARATTSKAPSSRRHPRQVHPQHR
ncbi:hypothetical protein CTI14_62740, partial [Methylobacterium radiotolerans]